MAVFLDTSGLERVWIRIKSAFVPQTRKINGKPLSADITLDASDLDLTSITSDISNKADASSVTALEEKIGTIPVSSNANTVIGYVNEQVLSASDSRVDVLVGSDTGKSVRTIAGEELASQLIPENAKASLDTLQEIASWIQTHPDDASAMADQISALQTAVSGKADSSTVSSLSATVSTLSDTVSNKADSMDVISIGSRVTTLETDIADKASSSSVTALGDRVNSLETNSVSTAMMEDTSIDSAQYHLGFYIDENGDLCQKEDE